MCDDLTMEDEAGADEAALNRRGFAVGAAAVGAAALFPAAAFGRKMTEIKRSDVAVKTPDGTADCYFVHPARGKSAGVIIWPDIFGLRPAFRQMADRLARSGYAVLVVNPYYRSVKAPVIPDGEELRSDANFAKVREQAVKLSPATNVTDAKAFVAFLDGQKAVSRKRKIGTTGYCMGGPMVMRTAAAVPARIGAGASFHGSSLANDKPDSPHLLVPQMKAQFLFAVADNDDQRNPDEKVKVKNTFAAAKLPAEIEVYQGAMHGWCPPDGKVYNHEQAERAWARLLALFGKALA
jgi:carboxymethylenebutenolidase